MSGPLIYRRGLFGAEFNPMDLTPDYFNANTITLDGTTDTPVDTGLYNTPWTKDYLTIYCKFRFNTAAGSAQHVFGGRTTTAARTVALQKGSARRFIYYMGGTTYTTAYFINNTNPTPIVTVRLSLDTTNYKMFVNGSEEHSAARGSITEQTSFSVYIGALNNNGTLTEIMDGTVYGFFLKSGAAPLSAEDITNLDNYFAAL